MSHSAEICLQGDPADSRDFGFSIDASDRWIAVGDPGAGRVSLYERTGDRFDRKAVIVPPASSSFAALGSGFGYDVAVDGSHLVIGAYLERRGTVAAQTPRWVNQLGTAYYGDVFVADLSRPGNLERVETDDARVVGMKVAAAGGRIGYLSKIEARPGSWVGSVLVTGGAGKAEISAPADLEAPGFAFDFDLTDAGIVASASTPQGRGLAVLYGLDATGAATEIERFEADAPGGFRPGVAMSGRYVASADSAVSNEARTTVFDRSGAVVGMIDQGLPAAFDGDRLAIAHAARPDGQGRTRVEIYAVRADGLDRVRTVTDATSVALHRGMTITTTPSGASAKVCVSGM